MTVYVVDPRALAIASHGATLTLDETGPFWMLIVSSARPLPPPVVRLCHALAGDMGAGLEVKRITP